MSETVSMVRLFFDMQGTGAKLRRQLLCDALGIDNCTGGALVTMLNRFFTRDQFEAAVEAAAAARLQD